MLENNHPSSSNASYTPKCVHMKVYMYVHVYLRIGGTFVEKFSFYRFVTNSSSTPKSHTSATALELDVVIIENIIVSSYSKTSAAAYKRMYNCINERICARRSGNWKGNTATICGIQLLKAMVDFFRFSISN